MTRYLLAIVVTLLPFSLAAEEDQNPVAAMQKFQLRWPKTRQAFPAATMERIKETVYGYSESPDGSHFMFVTDDEPSIKQLVKKGETPGLAAILLDSEGRAWAAPVDEAKRIDRDRVHWSKNGAQVWFESSMRYSVPVTLIDNNKHAALTVVTNGRFAVSPAFDHIAYLSEMSGDVDGRGQGCGNSVHPCGDALYIDGDDVKVWGSEKSRGPSLTDLIWTADDRLKFCGAPKRGATGKTYEVKASQSRPIKPIMTGETCAVGAPTTKANDANTDVFNKVSQLVACTVVVPEAHFYTDAGERRAAYVQKGDRIDAARAPGDLASRFVIGRFTGAKKATVGLLKKDELSCTSRHG